MPLTLDIEHADDTSTLRVLGPDDVGDTNTPSLQSARIEQQLVRQPDETDTAEVLVYRDAWNDIEPSLDRSNDRLVIREDGDAIFGGRLADFERDGVVVSVLIDGPKRDAIDAEPSGANDVLNAQPDSDIVSDELLTRVPTVDAGIVETVDNAIAFSESHASPGKSLTKLARDADAEVRYRATETAFELDYVARLGDDRSDETLAPASATVLGEPRIREDIVEDVTHVRVLGAGEGTAQVRAEAVADSFDPADDRPVYRRRVDKDIQQTERAQSLAETLVAEYDGSPEYLEIEFEIPSRVDPSVGDTFSVELPAHDIDTTLRITMLDRIIDAAGDRFRAVLSNRRHTADSGGEERARELGSLAEGNAGQIVRDSDNSGWDTVSSDSDIEFTFRPAGDIIGEFESLVSIESRPYRAFSSGAESNVSLDEEQQVSSERFPSTTVNDQNWTTIGSLDDGTHDFPTETTQEATFGWSISDVGNTFPEKTFRFVLVRLRFLGGSVARDEFSFSRVMSSQGGFFNRAAAGTVTLPGDYGSVNEIELQVLIPSLSTSEDEEADINGRLRAIWTDTHTHPPDPGLTEFGELQPENVDVFIDDEPVAEGLSPPIDETVDAEELLTDESHTIRASADSLGQLRLGVVQEVIKNISGDAI